MRRDAQPHPRRRATQFLLRGLATSLPTILTIVILIELAQGINDYIIHPSSAAVQYAIALFIDDSVPTTKLTSWPRLPPLQHAGTQYLITPELKTLLASQATDAGLDPETPVPPQWLMDNQWGVFVPFGNRAVPFPDYAVVAERMRISEMPVTSLELYSELVTIRYFRRLFHLSALVVLLSLVGLYFLGRLVTVRVGSWTMHKFETSLVGRVPLVSNVYSAVKQVTDFFLSERKVEYNRVVAVEYPRRGIWSVGFVTGDGMLEMTTAAGEPLVSVLMPTSPMPMTGFTISVPRGEVVDLDMTVDQAFQYCLSCGVLVPPHQQISSALLEHAFSGKASPPALALHPGPTADAKAVSKLSTEAADAETAGPSRTVDAPEPAETESSEVKEHP